MSHDPHVNESCCTCCCGDYVWHISFVRLMWFFHMWEMRDMPHVCVWHDSFMCVVCVTCLIHACDMTRSHVRYAWHGWHASFMCVAWLRDMTHSYVTWPIHLRIDSFIYDLTHSDVTWLILTWHGLFIRNMNYLYVTQPIHMWHDSFICVTRLIHRWYASFVCDIIYAYVTYVARLIRIGLLLYNSCFNGWKSDCPLKGKWACPVHTWFWNIFKRGHFVIRNPPVGGLCEGFNNIWGYIYVHMYIYICIYTYIYTYIYISIELKIQ